MTDLKHYGLNRFNRRLDGFLTGIAWTVATALLIFYGLGVMP